MSNFCKNCDNILGISRNAPKENILSQDTPTSVTSSDQNVVIDYDEIIEKISKNEKISDEELIKIDFAILLHNKNFVEKPAKLKSKIKKKIDELLEQKDSSDSNIKAYRVCRNCAYSEPIKHKQLIASRAGEGNNSTDIELSIKNKNKVFSNILPLTREYNCRNNECPTKKGEPGAAKFYRTRGTTLTWYTCTVCHETWRIS